MQNKKFLRSERVSDILHKELAGFISKSCRDPRLANLTITNVKLSNDLSVARVYFTVFGDINKFPDRHDTSIKKILKILKNASNFLRCNIANKLKLRKVPELIFFYDDNTIIGNKIERLLVTINQSHNNNV